jgi:hypothetical protein
MRKKQLRSGLVTLDYVMVLAVAFPVSVLLLFMLIRGLVAIYHFSSTLLGWIPF